MYATLIREHGDSDRADLAIVHAYTRTIVPTYYTTGYRKGI